ncbi:MAG TPA: alcohol dehydrogenase catalytic domain-containing protein, partial [Aggregicoccus sp.]|nr:alcohol dehydrogenase catalytic domain-containing protein [Aggregicoccus sp.]
MRACVLHTPGSPLVLEQRPVPEPGPEDVLVRVEACGVCRTDLHELDGELRCPQLPRIPGHEVVGTVVARGERAQQWEVGERVGIPWLGGTCGRCRFCLGGRENLCAQAVFTGCTRDGGYADYVTADARFCFRLAQTLRPAEAAPLLCAGLIGYRSLRLAGDAARLGLYGYGASAHLVAQVARYQGRRVFAFTRPGDAAGQAFARGLGAEWAGDS